MKNIVIIVLSVLLFVSIAVIGVGVHFIKNMEYTTVEHMNGEKTIIVRPITVGNNGTVVRYLPIDEEIQIYSSSVGHPMNIEKIFWMN